MKLTVNFTHSPVQTKSPQQSVARPDHIYVQHVRIVWSLQQILEQTYKSVQVEDYCWQERGHKSYLEPIKLKTSVPDAWTEIRDVYASDVLMALNPHTLRRFKKIHLHPQLKTKSSNMGIWNVEVS